MPLQQNVSSFNGLRSCGLLEAEAAVGLSFDCRCSHIPCVLLFGTDVVNSERRFFTKWKGCAILSQEANREEVSRMRLRNITGSREGIAESRFVIQEEIQPQCPGTWKEIFGNDRPIHIEIGMGKGKFIHAMAKQNPHINYVGIEKYSSVLLRALQKMELEELPNLKFLRMDAEDITKVFGAGEVDRIYLNFSDPWPKDRHAKRRLPSREFLARYNIILKKGGKLEFKTDNRPLFDFAVEELEPAGWKAEVITYDLHADEKLVEGNVMTEYEEKFSSMGNPICKYIIYR